MNAGGSGSGSRRILCLDGAAREILRELGAAGRILDFPGPSRLRGHPGGGSPPLVEEDLEEILALRPDLFLGDPGLPEGIARELGRRGVPVTVLDPGSTGEILQGIRLLAEQVGLQEEGRVLLEGLREGLERVRDRGEALLRHPRVFFEEWPDPLVSAGRWVSEMIGLAGGEDIFPELSGRLRSGERIVDPAEVVRREPEVILVSRRGGEVDLQRLRSRPGWERVPAVRRGKLFEIEASLVLEPGPRALSRGLERLHEVLAEASLG